MAVLLAAAIATIHLTAAGPQPAQVAVHAPEPIAFVNDTGSDLVLKTTMQGAGVSLSAGATVSFATVPGSFTFTAGVLRGSFTATGLAVARPAPVVYGHATTLHGIADADATVSVWALPRGTTTAVHVAHVTAIGGRWSLVVRPKVTTRYEVRSDGATVITRIYVEPTHTLTIGRGTIAVRVGPLPYAAHQTIWLYRLHDNSWGAWRSVVTDARGSAAFRGVPSGRYYVVLEGGGRYAGFTTKQFRLRG